MCPTKTCMNAGQLGYGFGWEFALKVGGDCTKSSLGAFTVTYDRPMVQGESANGVDDDSDGVYEDNDGGTFDTNEADGYTYGRYTWTASLDYVTPADGDHYILVDGARVYPGDYEFIYTLTGSAPSYSVTEIYYLDPVTYEKVVVYGNDQGEGDWFTTTAEDTTKAYIVFVSETELSALAALDEPCSTYSVILRSRSVLA